MPAKKKDSRAYRSAQKRIRSAMKNRVAQQPDGMPRGKHLKGFKGTKVDAICFCGGCHPNAQAGKNKVVYV